MLRIASSLLGETCSASTSGQPAGARELNVSDTIVTGDGSAGGGGVIIRPAGSGSAKVVLDNVEANDNATGIVIEGRATIGSNNVTIRNSAITGSTTNGIQAIDGGGGTTNVIIEGSATTNNGSHGVIVSGTAVVRMRTRLQRTMERAAFLRTKAVKSSRMAETSSRETRRMVASTARWRSNKERFQRLRPPRTATALRRTAAEPASGKAVELS